jgi:hypothetical protein
VIDSQDAQRKQDPLAQVGNAEDVANLLKHTVPVSLERFGR